MDDIKQNDIIGNLRNVDGNGTLLDILLEFETLIYNRLVSMATDNQIVAQKYGMYKDANDDYSFAEKKYIQYPFFKKWMIRNNIDNIYII